MYRDRSYLDSRMAKVLPPEGELVTDLSKLVHTMGQVALAAPEVDLPQFRYGFHGYQRVTRVVTKELTSDTFEHPDKMEQTMPYFAERAFTPIRHHIRGDVDKVGAWAPMLYTKVAINAPPSTAMIDFLGFHVIYDLPFTLRDTNTKLDHKQDYSERINTILANVGRQLLPEYIEVNPFLAKMKVPEIGLNLVLRHLFKSRDDAWKTFEELRDIETHSVNDNHLAIHSQIEHKLREKAVRRMPSKNKLANFIIRKTTRTPYHPWNIPELHTDL